MPGIDRAALAARLPAIMREAGELALRTFRREALRSWLKGHSSPVSEADIAVNEFLLERLQVEAPNAGWLSEETEDEGSRMQASLVWIVDPIDGTRAYIEGRTDWSISVALAENGRPVIAALYAPATDDLFAAVAGAGGTHNGAPLKANAGDTLDGARVAGPRSTLARLTALRPQIIAEPKVHSLALRFARVAQGTLDIAFAARNSHDWDLAAADLLVHEAGGALTDFAGQTLTYNRPEPVHGALLAAGHARHAGLVSLVRDRQREFA
ncbi:MAG TPA: 3'(2'),5'-bisphosphate nucleotidase CysQ [Pseudolabrys sp.]|nr:3'(2'),5'-bisphosphate nucleotidase CysQ [Pseudolabrys sp.]